MAALGAAFSLGFEALGQALHSYLSPDTFTFKPLRFVWSPLFGAVTFMFRPLTALFQGAHALMQAGIIKNLPVLIPKLAPAGITLAGMDVALYELPALLKGEITIEAYEMDVASAMIAGGVKGHCEDG